MLQLIMRAHEDLADFSALAVVADFGYFANTNAEPRLTRRQVGQLCLYTLDLVDQSFLTLVKERPFVSYSCQAASMSGSVMKVVQQPDPQPFQWHMKSISFVLVVSLKGKEMQEQALHRNSKTM